MRSYIFPTLVMLTAMSLALGAALFTIIGFRELFEPSFKIMYMAATIELGKIIAVSTLYQFRNILGWAWKSFLLVLILVAMGVTSMGVYGYLSSSFQKDSLGVTLNESRLELLDARKDALEARLEGMDAQIAEVPETYVTKRMELIATFKPERDVVLVEIGELDDRKLVLTLEKIDKETEFGPMILLAKSIEWMDETQAMFYFIVAVIFIFDPLAIALTYSANVGYATVAASRNGRRQKPEKIVVDQKGSDTGLMDKISELLKADRNKSDAAIASVAGSVERISDEVQKLKTNPRAEIIDSMRSKNNT